MALICIAVNFKAPVIQLLRARTSNWQGAFCVQGGYKEDRARPFSVVPGGRPRGNGHKLKHRRFPLTIRKHFVTVRVIEHWHGLPRELVESPTLEIFKYCLNVILGNQL